MLRHRYIAVSNRVLKNPYPHNDMTATDASRPYDNPIPTISITEHEQRLARLQEQHARQMQQLQEKHQRHLLFLLRQFAQERDALLDPVNRHATREAHGVDDQYLYEHPELLIEHYITHGGADAFATAYKDGLVSLHVRRRKKRKRKHAEPEYYI